MAKKARVDSVVEKAAERSMEGGRPQRPQGRNVSITVCRTKMPDELLVGESIVDAVNPKTGIVTKTIRVREFQVAACSGRNVHVNVELCYDSSVALQVLP